MYDIDTARIELSRMQREAYANIHVKQAALQLGECFRDLNLPGKTNLHPMRRVLDQVQELDGGLR